MQIAGLGNCSIVNATSDSCREAGWMPGDLKPKFLVVPELKNDNGCAYAIPLVTMSKDLTNIAQGLPNIYDRRLSENLRFDVMA